MNILLIGNGFDLAHGLPTRYTDFLEFIKVIKQLINMGNTINLKEIKWGNIDFQIKREIILKMEEGMFYCFLSFTWEHLVRENLWIEYFLKCDMYQKENWIDFESEMSNVIKSLNNNAHAELEDGIQNISNKLLMEIVKSLQPNYSYKQLKSKLINDLNRFILAFEKYLTRFVEYIDVKVISPDIIDIVAPIEISGATVSKVISFNYTSVYEKVYLKRYIYKSDYVDYVHGKADFKSTIDSNNMVLGIDEYLSRKRRNKDIEFIEFKKYYQRIHKGTGCKYREWVNEIHEDYYEYIQNQIRMELHKKRYMSTDMQILTNQLSLRALKDTKCKKHNLYIFGHSLDVTDKDILRDLILNDNVFTTIFYLNKKVKGQQIANLVKVIGQDELIRRTGNFKTIEFKKQLDMICRRK